MAKVSGAGSGDLIVRARLVVPGKLTRRENEIPLTLAEERNEDVREELLRRAREASSS